MKKFVMSLTSTFLSCIVTLNITSCLSSYAAYTRQLSSYPVYTQVGNNCWAYAILSMSNYMYGGYSIGDIYNIYENVTGETYDYNGANVNEAHDVMNYIFSDYNPVKKGQLTSNEIKLEINSNFPVYIRGDGHAVALMGYRSADASSSVVAIYYMNSATGKIMYSGYAEGTENTFYTNASQVYNWENSIIISG